MSLGSGRAAGIEEYQLGLVCIQIGLSAQLRLIRSMSHKLLYRVTVDSPLSRLGLIAVQSL